MGFESFLTTTAANRIGIHDFKLHSTLSLLLLLSGLVKRTVSKWATLIAAEATLTALKVLGSDHFGVGIAKLTHWCLIKVSLMLGPKGLIPRILGVLKDLVSHIGWLGIVTICLWPSACLLIICLLQV